MQSKNILTWYYRYMAGLWTHIGDLRQVRRSAVWKIGATSGK